MRLIDADALVQNIDKRLFIRNEEYLSAQGSVIVSEIYNAPTIKATEWIPCSERLPDLNENGVSDMVLLCWSDGQMTVGAYQGGRTFVGQAWPTARDCRVTVTAWQPLPTPWKGADDE